MAHDDTIRDAAAAWAVRTSDAAFDDWDGFTAWLEADPAHARAYDEVCLATADAAEALATLPAPLAAGNDSEPAPPRLTRRWLGGALAASLAGVLALGAWQLRGDPAYETAPGETEVIALDGGGNIALAGDSRLVLDRGNPRFARLERGQALFTIRHDESAPFRVKVGEDTLLDVGTVFDVTRSAKGLTVAVSEGAVLFNPQRQKVMVKPGEKLTREGERVELYPLPLAEVGEWARGRLTFRDADIAQVAADLSRATGIAFSVAPRAAGRRLSGSLRLDDVRANPGSLGALLGIEVRKSGETWEIGTS